MIDSLILCGHHDGIRQTISLFAAVPICETKVYLVGDHEVYRRKRALVKKLKKHKKIKSDFSLKKGKTGQPFYALETERAGSVIEVTPLVFHTERGPAKLNVWNIGRSHYEDELFFAADGKDCLLSGIGEESALGYPRAHCALLMFRKTCNAAYQNVGRNGLKSINVNMDMNLRKNPDMEIPFLWFIRMLNDCGLEGFTQPGVEKRWNDGAKKMAATLALTGDDYVVERTLTFTGDSYVVERTPEVAQEEQGRVINVRLFEKDLHRPTVRADNM